MENTVNEIKALLLNLSERVERMEKRIEERFDILDNQLENVGAYTHEDTYAMLKRIESNTQDTQKT